MASAKDDIENLISESSVGHGIRWIRFGRDLRQRRHAFRLSASYVTRHSGLTMARLMEIEAGSPPQASEDEIRAIAAAMGVDSAPLVERMPR